MIDEPPCWTAAVRALAERAPAWMRERASAELHIGGFTQTQLETPVLEVSDLGDAEAAARAVIFFLVVAAASNASVARVQCGRGDAAARLVEATRDALGETLRKVDDENVSLMLYFDVFLAPSDSISPEQGARLLQALEGALQP
ncbi:MAG: hypothetical protein P8R42_30145 [Candidatus Binatia bacterium]|nr:hypothetical protein [Candidatus Binatia bacterium]